MTCAVLRLLNNKLQALPISELLLHLLRLVANNQQAPLRLKARATGQHPLNQCGTCERLQDFRQAALHAGALPSSQDGDGKHGANGESAGI